MKHYMSWFPGTSNFGDLLGPYIYNKIIGLEPKFNSVGEKKTNQPILHFCGSLVQFYIINSNSVICGAGIVRKNDYIAPPLDITFVRGKYTRDRLIKLGYNCPETYGDPALILPKIYQPKNNVKKYDLGIIPHQIDYDFIKSNLDKICANTDLNIKLINLTLTYDNTIEKVIDEINECEKTISSSLHGIIVSQAYGIPSIWCELKNKLCGDGIKFHDYFSSINISNEPLKLKDTKFEDYINNIFSSFDKHQQPEFPIQTDYLLDIIKKTFNEPKYFIQERKFEIPNIVHFINLRPMKFRFIHLLSILSAYECQKPDIIYVYVDEEPKNSLYWNIAKEYVTVEKVNVPKIFRGKEIHHPQYWADIIRMEKLIERGGIYLDIDNLWLKKMDDLMNNKSVLGAHPENKDINSYVSISNSVILSIKDNQFLKEWYNKIHESIYVKAWAWHAVCLPLEILRDKAELQDMVNLVRWGTDFTPISFESYPFILNEKANNSIHKFDNSYCLAFYQSIHKDILNNIHPSYILKNNNIFTKLFEKYINIIRSHNDKLYDFIYNMYHKREYQNIILYGLEYIDLLDENESIEYQYILFFLGFAYSNMINPNIKEAKKYYNKILTFKNIDSSIKIWTESNLKNI